MDSNSIFFRYENETLSMNIGSLLIFFFLLSDYFGSLNAYYYSQSRLDNFGFDSLFLSTTNFKSVFLAFKCVVKRSKDFKHRELAKNR